MFFGFQDQLFRKLFQKYHLSVLNRLNPDHARLFCLTLIMSLKDCLERINFGKKSQQTTTKA